MFCEFQVTLRYRLHRYGSDPGNGSGSNSETRRRPARAMAGRHYGFAVSGHTANDGLGRFTDCHDSGVGTMRAHFSHLAHCSTFPQRKSWSPCFIVSRDSVWAEGICCLGFAQELEDACERSLGHRKCSAVQSFETLRACVHVMTQQPTARSRLTRERPGCERDQRHWQLKLTTPTRPLTPSNPCYYDSSTPHIRRSPVR